MLDRYDAPIANEDVKATGDRFDSAPISNTHSLKQWGEIITAAWHGNASGIFAAGNHLHEAVDQHGKKTVLNELKLPFGKRTRERLMAIAKHSVLATHVSQLPPRWGTLYALSRLPNDILEVALAHGRIQPGMTRRDVAELEPKDPESEEHEAGETSIPPAPKAAFAVAWDAAYGTEKKPNKAGREEITTKLDQAGRDDLCTVLSKKLRTELCDHLLSQHTMTNNNIAALANECVEMLDKHPDRYRSTVRQKLERIKKLARAEAKATEVESVEAKSVKSETEVNDRGASRRGIGKAGLPGKKFPTMDLEPNGTDPSDNQSYGLLPDHVDFARPDEAPAITSAPSAAHSKS